MKKLSQLIKKGSKLKTTFKGEKCSIYNNHNLYYYKLVKISLEQDFFSIYDLKLIKNYNKLEIKLAILILETDSMTDKEKEDDFSLLKFYDKKTQLGYYDILKTEKDKLKELDIKYQKNMEKINEEQNEIDEKYEKIDKKEIEYMKYDYEYSKNKINLNIKYNSDKYTVEYLGKTFIKDTNKYGTMYNYIQIILEDKKLTDIEKQFFISFIQYFDKLEEEDRIYLIASVDERKNIIETSFYHKNLYFRNVTEGTKYSINYYKGKKKTTILEDLIINSEFLNKFEKQNYLVSINLMNTKEKSIFKKALKNKDELKNYKEQSIKKKIKTEKVENTEEENNYGDNEIIIPKWLKGTIVENK